jgi:cysteinyl-tRNA synthetase
MHLYNTKTKQIEQFTPQNPGQVTLYHCGPTVYNFAHIGNLRAYVFADTLRRALEWNGYKVNQVINITDVGHLVSDGDEGEDKMLVAAKREGTGMETIIKKYSDSFFADLEALNCKKADNYPRATHHIPEQIALIKQLEEKGFTYTTSDGVYFDTSKDSHYADFAHLDIEGMRAGSRVELGEKKNSTDFALWKFHIGEGVREQEWESPWGKGFPGWHIECSAMAMKYLGETLDIHTGGVDHIPVHHTNEIAQSECATDKTFANYWMHVAFMNVDGQKMSKSIGNTYLLSELQANKIDPLAYRYWLLTGHYRTQLNFTFEAAYGAQTALERIRVRVNTLPENGSTSESYIAQATEHIDDDLSTARVAALIHEILADDKLSDNDKKATILKIDELLGLDLSRAATTEQIEVTPVIERLLSERKAARESKDFAASDRLRDELLKHGVIVKDTKDGQVIEKA